MRVERMAIEEVVLITPKVWNDPRGYFLEAFNVRSFSDARLPVQFVQDNHSRSAKGVLRGLHYQLPRPQGKLVSVIRGQIFDVAADIRRNSPTFGKWVGAILDDERRQALWIPPGFAHGFCVLSEIADVLYKCTDYYDASSERGVAWNDSTLAIDWPLDNPLLSAKDAQNPALSSERNDLPD